MEVWSSGDGRGEWEAVRALGCLLCRLLISNVLIECENCLFACSHLEMSSRSSEEERRLVQRTNDLATIMSFVELYI